jgi:ribonucleotide reductase beta subunit family protein with ferritin-like domain
MKREVFEEKSSLVGFHVSDPNINQFRLNLIKAFWNAQEVANETAMEKDRWQLNNVLTESERDFILHILRYFAGGDDAVIDFIYNQVNVRVKDRTWMGVEIQKAANEEIHSEVYALTIKYVAPEREMELMSLDEFGGSLAEKKLRWCEKSMSTEKPLANTVFVMLILEGLFFSSSFAAIFWFRERNLLPGIANANNMIINDEGEHNRFYFYIYAILEHKLPEEEAHRIMRGAVDVELEFVNFITPTTSAGMNPVLMGDYVKFVADDILVKCGYQKMWNIKNPFPFMASFALERKVDNFRIKNTNYQHFKTEEFVPESTEYRC